MNAWPEQPVIYEINAWTWLNALSRHYQRPVTLATVSRAEWDVLGGLDIDAVWLMGVWERSPAGIRIAREKAELQTAYRNALPDVSPEDVVGSPYCIHRYTVDDNLGGREGLAHARRMLAEHGIRLILDYVPNHVARDHPWVTQKPEYFIQGLPRELAEMPESYFAAGDNIIACGRDPYFPPWTDVAQLNAFHPGLRRAAIESLHHIAEQCDGVRCDMAMLFLGQVFHETWGEWAGKRPDQEYWHEIISCLRLQHPDFLFVGEAYWDLEWELQQQGFDYCYDKRLYDRLDHDNADSIRLHLLAGTAYQQKLVRFIENHDEPRASCVFPVPKLYAAALTVALLPGAKLFHEGQFEGRRVRLPVQLGRRPEEKIDPNLAKFYRKLLRIARTSQIQDADWMLCEPSGWPDNATWRTLLAWCWRKREDRILIVVNFSDYDAQAKVKLPWEDLKGRIWRLEDMFSGDAYLRDGDEISDPGLYVALAPWGFHCLKFC